MPKQDKVEAFDLDRFLGAQKSGEVKSGDLYYHPGSTHGTHIDLTVRMADDERRKYRLLLPPGAPLFPMEPFTPRPIRPS